MSVVAKDMNLLLGTDKTTSLICVPPVAVHVYQHRTVQSRTTSPPKIDDRADSSFRRPSKRDYRQRFQPAITLFLFVRATYAWVLLFAHIPFHGEPRIQRNTSGVVAII